MGFFITPALVGGKKDMMIGSYQEVEKQMILMRLIILFEKYQHQNQEFLVKVIPFITIK